MCRNQPTCRMLYAFALLLAVPVAASAQRLTNTPLERALAQELACAPQSPLVAPEFTMQIVGAPERLKALYGTGDTVIINAGSSSGVRAGQQYFVRRLVRDRFTEPFKGFHPISLHTAGWIRVDEVQADTAVATMTHACDGALAGDYLEPFALPAVPERAAEGQADFEHPAHLILADERRQMGASGEFMVVDRGSDQGVRPGQRVTFFRTTAPGARAVLPIGSGTALLIGRATSVVRIETSRDAIFVGDLAAMHR
jgi:hypothetical protein